VEAILVNDKEADQAPAVIVITAQVPAGERRLLKRNDVFAAGFEIVAPAMTVIVFRSDNGNRIVLEPGARIQVADVTKTGERYLLRTGSVFFEVLKALSFFNVPCSGLCKMLDLAITPSILRGNRQAPPEATLNTPAELMPQVDSIPATGHSEAACADDTDTKPGAARTIAKAISLDTRMKILPVLLFNC
jgi:hypothetical protein